jgi:hypothetical protein
MRQLHRLAESEDAVFIRLDTGSYRDGVRFASGKELSLQQFDEGCGISVRNLLENTIKPLPTDIETAYVGA